MSYDQTQASRQNYDDDSNYDPSGQTQDIDAGGDSTLSGAHGGSGFGQAGGYTGSQGRREGRQTSECDDNYSQTDPGMAGNRGGSQDTQNIQSINVPGGPMSGEQDVGSYGQTVGGQGGSRGYERDNDEYDDSGMGLGQGAGTGRAPKGSMGSKVMGGMEKLAGKVAGKPELQAKGEQRQSGF